MGKWMDGWLERLELNRMENPTGGDAEWIGLQHSPGTLTARERIDKLADRGNFDQIIDPEDTRIKMMEALEITRNKTEKLPYRAKVHGTPPR